MSRCALDEIYRAIRLGGLALVVALAPLVLPRTAPAQGDPADAAAGSAIKRLCQGRDAEGGYDWKMDGLAARVWVVCQSETRVLASVNTLDHVYIITMVYTAINRKNPDILSFATYDLSADGARTVNGRVKSHAVLRLSLEALRRGSLAGEFQRNAILPIAVNAVRTTPLPSLLADANAAFAFEFSGSFYVEEPKAEADRRGFQSLRIRWPACLVTAVDGDIRSANFHDSSNLAIWLPWGSAASGGNVFYATNGVEEPLAGKDSVTQIRGSFVSADVIEFYYFNSLVGLSGPLRAIRMDKVKLATNPCRPHL
jgi:hypothetical protein